MVKQIQLNFPKAYFSVSQSQLCFHVKSEKVSGYGSQTVVTRLHPSLISSHVERDAPLENILFFPIFLPA